MKRICSLLLLGLASLSAAECPWPSQFELDARLGSYREGAGALVWAPICQQCDRVTFVQAQAGNYRDLWTGNLGLGHRQLFCPNWAWGLNLFGDLSYSHSGHVYGQGSIGGEVLGKCWEARINGYFTGNSRHLIDEIDVDGQGIIINGNNIEVDFNAFIKEERTYYGFDVELGRGICFEHGQLWGYAGYYYFRDKGVKDIQGPRLRLEYQLDNPLCWYGTRLTVGGEYDYDPVHKSEGSLLVSFRIPLCKRAYRRSCMPCDRSCLSVCRQMGNRVRREPTVWVERIDRSEFREDILAQIFFVDGNNTVGAGTQIDPTDLPDAVNRAGVGDFIFLLNVMNLPIDGGASILMMQQDQTVIGFGDSASTTIDFGPFGVLTITDLNPPPHRATLVGDAGSTLITLADGATVRGIQLDGMGTADIGIAGTGVNNVLLFDIDNFTFTGITDFADCGININGGTSPVIRQVSVSGIAANNGIELVNTTGALLETVSVDMVTLSDGILFNGGSNATLTGIVITDVGNEALSFNGFNSASVTNANISGTAADWLFMDGCSGTFTFDNTNLGGGTPTLPGLLIGDNTAATTFTNSTLTQVSGDAVLVNVNSAAIDFTGLAINYSGVGTTAALHVLMSSGSVSFANSNIAVSVGSAPAVLLSDNSGLVSLDGMMLTMVGSDGVAIDSTNAGNLRVTNSMVTTALPDPTSDVIRNINTGTDGTIAFDNLTISCMDVTDRIVDIQAVGASSVTFTMNNSSVTAGTVIGGVRAIKSGVAGGTFMDATINDLTSTITGGPGGHILFETALDLSDATFTGTAIGNVVGSPKVLMGSDEGILLELGGAGPGAVTSTFTVQGYNLVDQTAGGDGIRIESSFASPNLSADVLVRNNLISTSTSSNGVVAVAIGGVGRPNVVMDSNAFDSASTGIGYAAESTAGFAGTLCTTLTSNSASSAAGIELMGNGGTYIITPSNTVPGLTTANPGVTGTITVMGTTVGQSAPCFASSCPPLE